MERGLPTPQFRLQKSHAFYLLDLVLAALIIMLIGRVYRDKEVAKLQADFEQRMQAVELESRGMIAQADSVMDATVAAVAAMKADSASKVAELENRRLTLDQGFADRQRLAEQLFRLSDVVLDLRSQSESELARQQNYQVDVRSRREELDALVTRSEESESTLAATREAREDIAEKLRAARAERAHEPVGMFPDRSGVALRQEITDQEALTNVELQHVLVNRPQVDLGLALGVGLGSGDRATNKEVGLLLSRPLIHRRLGLDVSAGYSILSDEEGNDDNGAFARAGLRFSPFFRERFHLALGARAGQGDVLPYVGVALGRR